VNEKTCTNEAANWVWNTSIHILNFHFSSTLMLSFLTSSTKYMTRFFGDIVFSQFMEILLIRFVNEAWTLRLLSVKGITVFTLILLIRTSWSFFKPYLQDKDWSSSARLGHLETCVFACSCDLFAVLFRSPLFVQSKTCGRLYERMKKQPWIW